MYCIIWLGHMTTPLHNYTFFSQKYYHKSQYTAPIIWFDDVKFLCKFIFLSIIELSGHIFCQRLFFTISTLLPKNSALISALLSMLSFNLPFYFNYYQLIFLKLPGLPDCYFYFFIDIFLISSLIYLQILTIFLWVFNKSNSIMMW